MIHFIYVNKRLLAMYGFNWLSKAHFGDNNCDITSSMILANFNFINVIIVS